jgi:hypothetical protein
MRLLAFASLILLASVAARAEENPFVGRWALTLPDGHAGWLGIEQKDGKLTGSLLWGGGSVLPVDEVKVDGQTLTVTRKQGKGSHRLTGTVKGDVLELTSTNIGADGKEKSAKMSGKRIAPVPPTPELSKVQYDKPIQLIGADLSNWRLVEKDAVNGWTIKDGVLSNRVQHEKGKHNGNLRTNQEFEDFKLTTEVRTLPGSNSGIYLRGIYEIQIAETHGKPLDPHNMGALYSRITPSVAAEKPVGEWQTMEITLVQRHVTVVLNGKTIIDNQPVLGCTGGALTSDETLPGPLMLQGDHTDIDYRNMVLTPVKK